MRAGDVAERVSAGHDGETERQCHARIADADVGYPRGEHGAAAAAEYKPECADEFGSKLS